MGDGEDQDFVWPQLIDYKVRKLLGNRSSDRDFVRDCFEMRIVCWVLLDVEQRAMQDTQEPTTKPVLPTLIPSGCDVGFSFCKVQESDGQVHDDISLRSDSIS